MAGAWWSYEAAEPRGVAGEEIDLMREILCYNAGDCRVPYGNGRAAGVGPSLLQGTPSRLSDRLVILRYAGARPRSYAKRVPGVATPPFPNTRLLLTEPGRT